MVKVRDNNIVNVNSLDTYHIYYLVIMDDDKHIDFFELKGKMGFRNEINIVVYGYSEVLIFNHDFIYC